MVQQFTQENVVARVEKIIREQIGSDADLSPETQLQDDLGMDSLELVELGITLEKEFGIELPDEEVRRCVTLGDIVHLVQSAGSEEKVKSV